jgi:GH15 family glucan-1,4-alpha-glucosidase
MAEYPDIGEHGLIGDLQTSALVATDGTIDWFCGPRFDSPSVFASLLDSERGGYFRIAPDRPGCVSRQLYLSGTAVLITRFMTPDGVGELADFMPLVHQPRVDYGRGSHKTEVLADGVAFHGADGSELALHIARRPGVAAADAVQPEYQGEGVLALIDVAAGEVDGLILESAPDRTPRHIQPDEVVELFEHTRDLWRSWVGRSRYAGRWRESVERSAIPR